MHVTVLMPDIHDLQTGGNIYNRRIIEEVRRDIPVEPRSWDPETTRRPQLDLPDDAVLLIDSLLTRHPASLRALRDTHPSTAFVLLGHYLHCIDPGEQNTKRADEERALLDMFDGVVTTSRYARRALVREGVPGPRIGVVPPGLDTSYRHPPTSLPLRPTPRLITVANLLPGKGLRPFVEVLQALSAEAWTWTLVGDASLDPTYARDVHRSLYSSRLADRVTYTGSISPAVLRTWYDRSDVFVLPSRFETCSMATREAMARGLPVVGYHVGGLPENMGDAPVGHLVPAGDTTALKEALRSLLTDPMKRSQMGKAARRRSQAFPTWPDAASQFQSVLEDLMTARRSSNSNVEDDS